MFNFQGTSAPRLIGDSLVILAHRFPFVNNFFQILLNFFNRCFRRKQPVTAECLANIAPEAALVNTFFAIFSNFFRGLNLVVFQGFQPLHAALCKANYYLCSKDTPNGAAKNLYDPSPRRLSSVQGVRGIELYIMLYVVAESLEIPQDLGDKKILKKTQKKC